MNLKKVGLVVLTAFMVLAFVGCGNVDNAVSRSTVTYTTAPEIFEHCGLGYNEGQLGPITVTQGTYKTGSSTKAVYLIGLSGTELVEGQSTGVLTDLLSGFGLTSCYLTNVVNVILENIPEGSNLIIAGHSLGGMIAQQVAADDDVKDGYNVLNTVTFGSPLLKAGSREGTVIRLGDTVDPVPYLSSSIVYNSIWAILGLNRENGGYGTDLIAAHCESYARSDVWGAYDVIGKKNGSATLTLDLDSLTYYQSPTSY
ncbi:MAG: alpha/beta hydrolase [Treponemataceae bacterium]|nr:alpha/beta hydrolase [Treponemataceae bacterium]